MSWKCNNCQLINVRYVKKCYCNSLRPNNEEYDDFDSLLRELTDNQTKDISFMAIEQSTDLFTQFYNHEKILVSEMTVEELREHRDKLRKIILEAKARYQAADDVDRERKSRVSAEKKTWLVTDEEPNPLVTDAIAAVKTRADRMSKADKLKKQLEAMGLDDEFIKDTVKNLEKKATETNLNKASFNIKKIIEVEKKVEVEKKESKPFDASSLKFGS